MQLSRILTCLILLAGVCLFFSARPTYAQTLDPPARDMAQFRQCLARASNDSVARECDAPIYAACNARSDQPDTTISISECTITQHLAWDKALNEIWPNVLREQSPQARTKLRAAQRLWISLRSADCAAVYEANIGGTIRGPASAACLLTATKERYFWLKSFPN